VAIRQHDKRISGTCSLGVRRNAYIRASSQKSNVAFRFGDDTNFLYQWNNSLVRIHVRYVLATSLIKMRRNSINFASGLKTTLTIVFNDHDCF